MRSKICRYNAGEDSGNSQRVSIVGPIKTDTDRIDAFRSVTKALLSFEHKPPSQLIVIRPRNDVEASSTDFEPDAASTRALLSFEHKLPSGRARGDYTLKDISHLRDI